MLSERSCLFIFNSSPKTIKDIFEYLEAKLASTATDDYTFNIRRDCVLEDILEDVGSASFCPYKIMKTYFVGEVGEDTGGLTRELWRLFSREVRNVVFEGQENARTLRHDSTRLKVSCNKFMAVVIALLST